jgi:hypothetical protein
MIDLACPAAPRLPDKPVFDEILTTEGSMGQAKKKNVRQVRGRTPRLSPGLILAGTALALALAGIVVGLALRPRYVWYVEEGLESEWRRVINTAGAPKNFQKEPVILRAGETAPARAGGFVITTRRERSENPVTVYPRLSFTLEHEGAHVLALDPWMIFRNHRFPGLSRSRIESAAGGSGELLVPGKDPAAVRAWTARMVQEAPGVFPEDPELWKAAEASLFADSRFRQGSRSFAWQDVWFFLLGENTAWTYAPLSRVRDLPNYRSSILEASPFPEPGNANVICLQARILWAIPAGNDRTRKKLEKTLDWLKAAETQTFIADTFQWLPANPDGKPYDPLAMSARLAWLTASYVWETGAPETAGR